MESSDQITPALGHVLDPKPPAVVCQCPDVAVSKLLASVAGMVLTIIGRTGWNGLAALSEPASVKYRRRP